MSSVCAESRRSRRRLPIYLLAIARSIAMLVTVWRENMRDQHRLAVMGDRELQDIGLSRTEVADEIRRSFWREMNGRLP